MLGKFSDATNALGNFLLQFFQFARGGHQRVLTLGELQLKGPCRGIGGHEFAGVGARQLRLTPQHLPQQRALAGKAHLNRGWCFWLATNYPASLLDFKKAVELLPRSEDLAVARFKLGDALFQRR